MGKCLPGENIITPQVRVRPSHNHPNPFTHALKPHLHLRPLDTQEPYHEIFSKKEQEKTDKKDCTSRPWAWGRRSGGSYALTQQSIASEGLESKFRVLEARVGRVGEALASRAVGAAS
eukprot:585677-Amorphochlora_amoeboformis.AAC.1